MAEDATNADAETSLLGGGAGGSAAAYGAVSVPSTDGLEASKFPLGPEDLLALVDPKSAELLAKLGGVAGLAAALRTDLAAGLEPDGAEEAPARTSVGEAAAPWFVPRRLTIAANATAVAVRSRFFRTAASLSHKHLDGLESRRKAFGSNSLPEPMQSTIFQLMWEALQDRTIQVLMAAAAVEMGIGIYKARFASPEKQDSLALIDGIAIIAAIIIVILVGSISDLQKQAQFRALSEFGKSLLFVKVIRSGETRQIPCDALVVGDVCLIQTGDVVPADGVLIQGFNIEADESTLTGEPYAIRKNNTQDPFLLSGTKVVNGVGRMLVTGTGVNSLNGRSILALEVEPEETPLQEKLGKIADTIAKFAITAGIIMIVTLLIMYLIINSGKFKSADAVSEDILQLFILAVTIIVVAVPEGLPLAVTLSLAHATVRMLKDNNLVRHLAACETMGNATTICSDKTGTLTMNKMTVVRGRLFGVVLNRDTTEGEIIDALKQSDASRITNSAEHARKLLALAACSFNVNSSASESADRTGKIVFTGSNTEIAILECTARLGFPYKQDRDRTEILQIEPFSSELKRMSTLVALPRDEAFESAIGLSEAELSAVGTRRRWIFVKGASEIILSGCTRFVTPQGIIEPITHEKRAEFQALISEFADGTLRTISAAIKPLIPPKDLLSPMPPNPDQKLDDMTGLILLSIFGILDPVRLEVPDAVASCQRAGITVRMVTGDNLATAKAIARECKILSPAGIIMEGPEFRKLSQERMDEILPHLQVLARSSPLDKQILVKGLKRLGETVAVTGDGTNDAPALASADVGFSMGISGSEVAKEASDIVLMDDNFVSLVKAVVWGRTVYDSIRKFLQFQLTVNASAVIITLVSAFATTTGEKRTPLPALSAVQLLWINLIMDTLAALALATDPPSMEVLNRKPSNRSEPIISPDMMRQIVAQAVFQIVAILTIYYKGFAWWGYALPKHEQSSEAGVDELTATIIFNTFVFCQVFNEINSRSITRDCNVFKNIHQNKIFLVIIALTVFLQVIIVQFAGRVFKTREIGLSAAEWGICILVGAGSLPVGFITRMIPDINVPVWKSIKRGFYAVKSSSLMALNVMPHYGSEADVEAANALLVGDHGEILTTVHDENVGSGHGERSVPIIKTKKRQSLERWHTAISSTRMQLRVVRVFKVPNEDAQFAKRLVGAPPQRALGRSGTAPILIRLSSGGHNAVGNTTNVDPDHLTPWGRMADEPSTGAETPGSGAQTASSDAAMRRAQNRQRASTSPTLSPMIREAMRAVEEEGRRQQEQHDQGRDPGAQQQQQPLLPIAAGDAGYRRPLPATLTHRASVGIIPMTHRPAGATRGSDGNGGDAQAGMWAPLRSVMSATQAFHRGLRPGRVDVAALQMVDPNRVRMGAGRSAVRRHSHSHSRAPSESGAPGS